MTSKIRCWFCLAVAACLVVPVARSADVTRFENPDTALRGWRLSDDGFQIELIQRMPIQTRAFFEARGLPLDVARVLGATCVMQTIVRNTHDADAGVALHVDLSTWSIAHGGERRPIVTKDAFLDRWRDRDVDAAGRVAFRWATFPTEQTFYPGDGNWGMTMLGAAPGTVVDVRIGWRVADVPREAWIRGVECAADRE